MKKRTVIFFFLLWLAGTGWFAFVSVHLLVCLLVDSWEWSLLVAFPLSCFSGALITGGILGLASLLHELINAWEEAKQLAIVCPRRNWRPD